MYSRRIKYQASLGPEVAPPGLDKSAFWDSVRYMHHVSVGSVEIVVGSCGSNGNGGNGGSIEVLECWSMGVRLMLTVLVVSE